MMAWARGWRLLTSAFALLLCVAAREAPSDPVRTVLVMLRMPADHFRADGSYGSGYDNAAARSALTRSARQVARRHHLQLEADWPMPVLGIDCFIMRVADSRSATEAADETTHDPSVAWAQPLQTYRTSGEAAGRGDPLLAVQPAQRAWRLDLLHRLATGNGVTVAVIDSRVDAAHPDLAGQIAMQQDFVDGGQRGPERHGTEVAGLIAARGNNGIGIVGIAPAARLLALRACREAVGDTGAATCDSLSLAKALNYAVARKVQIINLSLTGPYDILLARLIAAGHAQGAMIVGAVDPLLADGGFPASQPGVIGVSDRYVTAAGRSFYVAPGRDVPTTGLGGTWLLVNGSSFAAAQVSGLMALARERAPRRQLLPVSTATGDVDACRTVGCREPACTAPCAVVLSNR